MQMPCLMQDYIRYIIRLALGQTKLLIWQKRRQLYTDVRFASSPVLVTEHMSLLLSARGPWLGIRGCFLLSSAGLQWRVTCSWSLLEGRVSSSGPARAQDLALKDH